jgi:hypothetical protein
MRILALDVGIFPRAVLLIGAMLSAIPAAEGQPLQPAAAQAAAWQQVGTLDCTIGPSVGLVVGGRQHARCAFKHDEKPEPVSYIGRLEKVGRAHGLPSGGKLTWTVFSASDISIQKLSGLYRASVAASGFDGRGAHTVCRASPESICLRPAVGEAGWKPNLAAAISVIRLDGSLARRKSSSARSQ